MRLDFAARSQSPANWSFTEWSDDQIDQTIAQRFESQVVRAPDHIAVRGSTEFTYDGLNRLANRLAHALLENRSQDQQRVALLMSHDVPLIAAILAVMKSGQICVSLSPTQPETRLTDLLENAGVDVIITDTQYYNLARDLAPNVRYLVELGALDTNLPDHNPGLEFAPQAHAFIIYTSGSTGKSRGVLQNHRNVLHNVRRFTRTFHFCFQDRICLLASPSTGQGLSTTFCALLNGATLCPRDLAAESVAGLAEWLIGEEITVYISAATVFRHFIRTLSGCERFPCIRSVRLGSEVVRPSDFDDFKAHFEPWCIFANVLSSTETGNLTQFMANRNNRFEGNMVPVGHAVEDMEIELLDDFGKPVDIGEVGEIVVKSRYLSPGYWREPEETRKAFQTASDGDKRTFSTRDLGRWHADGNLEYIGRKDLQVKIRGFRVNPEEARNALCKCPAVSDAVVDAEIDRLGNTRLVAYVLSVSDMPPTPQDLRQYLRKRLPDYLLPTAFVITERFPKTPNGKVDRAKLRELKPAGLTKSRPVKPRTAIEKLLVGIYAEVLDVAEVSIDDSFFDLGGDSLTVTQLLCRVEERLRVDFPITLLFENPTIAALSEKIEKRLRLGQDTTIPALKPVPRDSPLPLSFSQERTWHQSQTVEGAQDHIVVNGYVITGPLDVRALHESLNGLVRRHEVLRATFPTLDGNPVQIIGAAEPLEMRVIDLTENPNTACEIEHLMRDEARSPIDLAHGPMLRATLVRLHETKHRLVLANHHIVSDAWSRDILLRELGTLYCSFCSGATPRLSSIPVQYADFAVWQRNLLRRDGAHFREQLNFWKEQLSGVPCPLELPFRSASLSNAEDAANNRLPWSISAEVSGNLRALGREQGATLFMTRLAGFAALLHQMTGNEDFVIGSYMTNRNRPEIQEVIGSFINILMFRINLRGDPTFRELLARIRKLTLDATARGDIPFEDLCAELRRDNVLPELRVIFSVTYGEADMRFGNLEVHRLGRRRETNPWGLELSVQNSGDGSEGFVRFDTRLYAPAGVSKMIAQFQSLLAHAALNPELRLSQLRLDSVRAA